MLILTRRVGETLIIGNDEVKVNILGVKGNQVRIGVDAPPHVSVHREEIYERIKKGEKAKGPNQGQISKKALGSVDGHKPRPKKETANTIKLKPSNEADGNIR